MRVLGVSILLFAVFMLLSGNPKAQEIAKDGKQYEEFQEYISFTTDFVNSIRDNKTLKCEEKIQNVVIEYRKRTHETEIEARIRKRIPRKINEKNAKEIVKGLREVVLRQFSERALKSEFFVKSFSRGLMRIPQSGKLRHYRLGGRLEVVGRKSKKRVKLFWYLLPKGDLLHVVNLEIAGSNILTQRLNYMAQVLEKNGGVRDYTEHLKHENKKVCEA